MRLDSLRKLRVQTQEALTMELAQATQKLVGMEQRCNALEAQIQSDTSAYRIHTEQGLMIEAQKTDPTMPIMGMWTISPIGIPSAIIGIAFVVLVSGRLLYELIPELAQCPWSRRGQLGLVVGAT